MTTPIARIGIGSTAPIFAICLRVRRMSDGTRGFAAGDRTSSIAGQRRLAEAPG